MSHRYGSSSKKPEAGAARDPATGRTQQPPKSRNTGKLLRQVTAKIEKLEEQITSMQERASAADYYLTGAETIRAHQAELKAAEQALEALYQEWEELESGN